MDEAQEHDPESARCSFDRRMREQFVVWIGLLLVVDASIKSRGW